MKAIRVHQTGGPEVMKLEEIPVPAPGPKQVLVKVHAAGINPVDTYIREGKFGPPTLPYTPGLDAAGVVETVGSDVTRVSVKDRVYTSGTITGAYAEFTLCEESQVHPLPVSVSFSQGAGVNIPYATAYRALFQRAKAQAGDFVLVHGASGGVGIAAVQIARAAGLAVIGTAGTKKGLHLVAQQGAHYVVDHSAPNSLDNIKAITSGRGVDVILEMLSNVNLNNDLSLVAKGGRIVVIGSRGTIEIDPRIAMMQEATILGMVLFNATEEELFRIHAALIAGLSNGTLRPVVGRELPLAEARQAHQAVMEPGAFGKIILKI